MDHWMCNYMTNIQRIAQLGSLEFFGEKELLQCQQERQTSVLVISEETKILILNQPYVDELIQNQIVYSRLQIIHKLRSDWRQCYRKKLKLKSLSPKRNKTREQQIFVHSQIHYGEEMDHEEMDLTIDSNQNQKDRRIIMNIYNTPIQKKPIILENISQTTKEDDQKFTQTVYFQKRASLLKKYKQSPSQDETINWIMDKETFHSGMRKKNRKYKIKPNSIISNFDDPAQFSHKLTQDSLRQAEQTSRDSVLRKFFISRLNTEVEQLKTTILNGSTINRSNEKYGIHQQRTEEPTKRISQHQIQPPQLNLDTFYNKVRKRNIIETKSIERNYEKMKITGNFYELNKHKK